jgi:hypothetical protein
MAESRICFSRIGLDYWLWVTVLVYTWATCILQCVDVCMYVYGIATKPCSHVNHAQQGVLTQRYIHCTYTLSSRKSIMFVCSEWYLYCSQLTSFSTVSVQYGECHHCVFMDSCSWVSICGVMLVPFWGLGRPSLTHASVCCLYWLQQWRGFGNTTAALHVRV